MVSNVIRVELHSFILENRCQIHEIKYFSNFLIEEISGRLLYTITQTFQYFRTLPMHTFAKERQADATYYFHSTVYFLTVDMPKIIW